MGQHKKLLTPLKLVCLVFSLFTFSFILNAIATNSASAAETRCLQFTYTMGGQEGRSAPVCMPVENGKVKISSPSDVTVNGGIRYDGGQANWEACSGNSVCTIAEYSDYGVRGAGVYIGFGFLQTGFGAGGTFGAPAQEGATNSGTFKNFGQGTGSGPIRNGDDWETVSDRFHAYFQNQLSNGMTTAEGVGIDISYKGKVEDKKTEIISGSDLGTGETTTEVPQDIIVEQEPTNNDDNQIDSAESGCYKHSGSMGWIICPIIFGMRDVADNLYGGVESFLQVNSSIVTRIAEGTSGQGSIFNAWALFRNLANIVFVIFFLFVIFSQLTGYGIDNYGIKKVLPKLIITAILVNLSFLICAIAVDISNILGSALHDFFSGIAVTADINGTDISQLPPAEVVKQVTAYSVDFALGAGAVLGVGGAALALGGWSLVVPILLFLITFVISVIFAFITLGLRQAAVIVLIAIAPVAFVLNLLPNTEKYFKKWIDTFKGVLIVYPIIGALIGGGNFAGRILVGTSGDFLMTLVAGILFVAPLFLIPSLTRKSLDGIAGLGGRLQGLRRGATGRTRNFANNTQAMKNLRSDMSERQAQARAQRYLNRRGRRTEQALRNGQRVSVREARRYSRAQELAQAGNKANLAAYDALLSEGETSHKLQRMQNGGLEAARLQNLANDEEQRMADQRMINGGFEAAHLQNIINNDEKSRANDRMVNEGGLLAGLNQNELNDAQTRATNRRLRDDTYVNARIQGIENKIFEDAVKDRTSQYENEHLFDDTASFQQAVQNAATSGDDIGLEALMRKAAKGSDDHRQALRNGMDAAFKAGGVSTKIAQQYASSTTGDTIYKNQNRSMHDQGQSISRIINAVANADNNIAGAATQQDRDRIIDETIKNIADMTGQNEQDVRVAYNSTINSSLPNGSFANVVNNNTGWLSSDNFVGKGIMNGKQSSSAAFNYDDGEFNAIINRMQSNNATEEERRQIAEFMGGALWLTQNDPNGQYNNVKPEVIQQIKNTLAYATSRLNDSTRFTIDTSAGAPPIQQQINNHINNGANGYIKKPDAGIVIQHT